MTHAAHVDAFWSEHCAQACDELVRRALAEDLGTSGDVTTAVVADARGMEFRADAQVVAREPGILCGIRAAHAVCAQRGASFEPARADGSVLRDGDAVARVHGPPGAVLAAERTLLNLLGLLSGTATLTRAFADAVAGTRAAVMDTRKTIPGLRAMQKYAVLCGGGVPHRMGLHDAFLAKDNHLAGLDPGGIAALVRRCSGPARARGARFVECEVDSLEQLRGGVLDAVVMDDCIYGFYADRFPELRAVDRPFGGGTYTVLTAPDTPRLAAALDAALGRLIADGRRADISAM